MDGPSNWRRYEKTFQAAENNEGVTVMIMPDGSTNRQNTIRDDRDKCSEFSTIPVDPAGDYHYQDSAKPCEAIGID